MNTKIYISYWLSVLETADQALDELKGRSELVLSVRQIALRRKREALTQLAELGYQADVRMEITASYKPNFRSWEQEAVDEIIAEEGVQGERGPDDSGIANDGPSFEFYDEPSDDPF